MQNSNVSPAQAATELIRRRTARQSLIAFTEYTKPDYEPAPHHKLIANKLEAVIRGEIDRLAIFMPPRHGKSELASRRFPAFALGQNPKLSIIGASYNSDLANDFGREVRNIARSPECRNVFPNLDLAQDSTAANRWHTTDGGGYVAAGVGTAITGRGADIFLIDDPIKDREEADSERRREMIRGWYGSTAYTRLSANGSMVLIQTRWHEDDLAGYLLEEMQRGGDQWDVLNLPAIDDDGKALWPQRFDQKRLARIKAALPVRDWSALYQQSPAPDEGLFFKRDWFRWYDEPPRHLRTYGASDYAVSEGKGDFTVHGVMGVDADDNLYVLDWWRGRYSPDVWIEAFLDLMDRWKTLNWAEEQGQIVKSVGPFIEKRQRERRVYGAREQFVSTADKPTRARSFQARAAMGKVYLPSNAPWLADLMAELLSFPAAKHDDQVDVLSLFGRMLDDLVSGGRDRPDTKPKRDRWARLLDDDIDESDWRTA